MKIAIGTQIVALALGCVAVIWGVFAALWVAFPGPSGEWASLGVLACWAVNVPIGLLTLAVGLTVKHGSPRLGRLSIVIGLVALSLPIISSLIGHQRR